MTRKDYIKLATALAYSKPIASSNVDRHTAAQFTWRQTVSNIADVLQVDNSRFNRETFLRAAHYLD